MSDLEQNLMNPLKITYRGRTFYISSEDAIPENVNLSGFDFSRIRRTSRNLYNGRLNLRGADLSFLNLTNCNLENVDLSYANLFTSNLDRSRIANSIFFECDIQGAKFTNLQSTNGANFTASETGDTEFTNTNLSNVYFNDWYDKMYPRRGEATLDLTDEQQIQLNTFNRTFPTQEALENAIREGEERLDLPFNENENNNVFQPFLTIEREREQAEEDVRQGLNEEQRGMQQADIEGNQARLQDRLRRATAQAQSFIANNEDESEFGICSICQDKLNNGENVVDAHNNNNGNESGHIFHKDCLEGWCGNKRNVKCPLCNTNINCNEISNGSINITLKGGKRSKQSRKKSNKRKSNKRKVTNKREKRRVTNKRGKRRY